MLLKQELYIFSTQMWHENQDVQSPMGEVEYPDIFVSCKFNRAMWLEVLCKLIYKLVLDVLFLQQVLILSTYSDVAWDQGV